MRVRAIIPTIHEEIGVVQCIKNYKRPSATSLGLRYFSAGIRSIKTEIKINFRVSIADCFVFHCDRQHKKQKFLANHRIPVHFISGRKMTEFDILSLPFRLDHSVFLPNGDMDQWMWD